MRTHLPVGTAPCARHLGLNYTIMITGARASDTRAARAHDVLEYLHFLQRPLVRFLETHINVSSCACGRLTIQNVPPLPSRA